SGLAVVISLIALTLQLRQSTTMLKRLESNAQQAQFSTFRMAIASSRDIAQVWIAGRQDDSDLDAVDEVRFRNLVGEGTFGFLQLFDRHRKGLWDSFDQEARSLTALLSTKRGDLWWQQNKAHFPKEFIDEMDNHLHTSRVQLATT